MVVPRKHRDYRIPSGSNDNDDDDGDELVLSINAFGYLGLILGRGDRATEEIQNIPNGPITILNDVSITSS